MKVTVRISPNGDTKVAVEGVAGPGCQSLTAGLEKALGTTTENQQTSEFFEDPAQDLDNEQTA